MQTRAGMDQLQQYLQNILTEHLQNMHGSPCSIKFTWQQNYSRQGLGEITITCSNRHGKIASNNNSDFAENNIRLQCLELSNNMIQELIMENKGMS